MCEYKKLMSVVKDVDLEAMPTSIFLNDEDVTPASVRRSDTIYTHLCFLNLTELYFPSVSTLMA